jgi:hypothetical protein
LKQTLTQSNWQLDQIALVHQINDLTKPVVQRAAAIAPQEVSFDPQPQIHGDVIFHVVGKFLAYFPAADFHIESLSAAPSDVQIDEANPHQIHQSPKSRAFFVRLFLRKNVKHSANLRIPPLHGELQGLTTGCEKKHP